MFMQFWNYQILTLKIPLKCVGLCGKHKVWVNQILTLKISLKFVGFIWQACKFD